MPFNVAGAIAAGYTNEEIQAYLALRPAPNPQGLTDEQLIQRQYAATNTKELPYEYAQQPLQPGVQLPPIAAPQMPAELRTAPPQAVPGVTPVNQRRREPTSVEEGKLWEQSQHGLEPTLAPTGWLDLAMEGVGSFLEEADLGKYLLPLSALAMVKTGKPPKAQAGANTLAGMTKKEASRLPVGRGELTGENVLEAAARLNAGEGMSYGQWIKENPEAGGTLFDLANAKQAGVFPPGELPRTPVGKANIDRTVAAFRKPRVIQQLQEWVNAGMGKMPDSWYRTGPLYDEYVKEWGEALAPEKMRQQLEYIAATSTSAKVPDNLKIGSLYNYLEEQGLPIPESGPPKGYGHKFWMSHRDAARGFREETFNPLDNPKRASYVQNLGGNENVLTADRHFWRAVGIASGDPRFLKTRLEEELPNGTKVIRNLQKEFKDGKITLRQAKKEPQWWSDAPTGYEYGYAEDAFKRKVADPMGLTVGQGQEKQWVGAGEVTGLGSPGEPILQTLARRIAYTAYQMGVSPEEVLSAYVRGKIPLLQVGGAVGLGLGTLSTLSGTPPSDGDKRPSIF